MKAKYINNRPAKLMNPENINIGDIVEENNPPRGVNFWKVLDKEINGNTLVYQVEMLQGSAFTGAIYYKTYQYKTIGTIAPTTAWFFEKMSAIK